MKKILWWLLTVLLLSTMLINVSAAPRLLVDDAGLLTIGEEEKLSDVLEDISSRLQADIVVLTVDSLNGRSAGNFADSYYDENGYADDGILLLIAMQEREWYISTCGSCIGAVDRWGTDHVASYFLDDLSDGAYYDAFLSFALTCEKLLAPGQSSDGPVITYGESDEGLSGSTVIICLCIGLGVGLITVFVMRAQLKSVRAQGSAGNYVVPGSMNVTKSREIYLYRNVTRREKPKNNSSGGGGGRSHGGGGGRF